ncbi:Hypothetical predicted protein [Olea europaea subsp. europaea]|uniref:Uncharacterized protein n=1 Tax=Olea europaea subsp. europaea TaxID=158383 RepID=A0A8S0TWI0_OLEEU|nr:Hypothetical predicted protein [Olea europaea subsp. europaea]
MAILEKTLAPSEASPAVATAPVAAVPLTQVSGQPKRKRARPSKELKGLVKDLNAKKEDLVKCLEEVMQYGDAVREARAKATEEEKGRREVEAQLAAAKGDTELLKKELYDVEVDHANEHHRLATEALEASNKERAELRQRAKAQSEEIASLNEELKSAGEVAVQIFIDHFEEHPLYDDFANFWASWSAQGLLGRLKEAEFGGPTRGWPDMLTEDAPEAPETGGEGPPVE